MDSFLCRWSQGGNDHKNRLSRSRQEGLGDCKRTSQTQAICSGVKPNSGAAYEPILAADSASANSCKWSPNWLVFDEPLDESDDDDEESAVFGVRMCKFEVLVLCCCSNIIIDHHFLNRSSWFLSLLFVFFKPIFIYLIYIYIYTAN